VREYEDAIKRDPKNATYYCNAAAALSKLSSWVDARTKCEKAIELDETYIKAYSRLATIQFFMKEYHKAIETYQKALKIEPDNEDLKQGLQRTHNKIQSTSGDAPDKERIAHAMADPEIQAILRDPMIQSVLQDFQENPQGAQKHLQNTAVRAKIEKLINAGVLQMK